MAAETGLLPRFRIDRTRGEIATPFPWQNGAKPQVADAAQPHDGLADLAQGSPRRETGN